MSKPKTTEKKIDLTPSLARPLDKAALSNDSATLRALTGMLNNPAITGAVVEAEEKYSAAPSAAGNGATIVADSTPIEEPSKVAASLPIPPPLPAPAPAPIPKTKNYLILLTGRNVDRVSSQFKSIAGSSDFNIYSPVTDLATMLFPAFDKESVGGESFLKMIRLWGTGEVNDDAPISAERVIFVKMIRSIAATLAGGLGLDWAKYGTDAGFWVDSCYRRALEFHDENPNTPIFITGISDKYERDYFSTRGFTHWHVTGRPAPNLPPDPFSTAMDNDVVRQVSHQRTGPKLRAIWSETVPPNSNRLWTIPEFVSSFNK